MATREFRFNENKLELVIEGNVYAINPFDESIVARQSEFSAAATQMAQSMKATDEDGEKSVRLCIEFIDGVLGEGATARIFENRKIGVYDLFDVVNYINDEIRIEREKRMSGYNKNPKYNTHRHGKGRK